MSPSLNAPPEVDAEEAAPVSETVLVVDDDPDLRVVASLLLQRNGFRVLTAKNGDHACKIARENAQIDALLTDIEMPGMRGDELADWFLVTRPHAAVIFMSGNPRLRRQREPHSFVEKPFFCLSDLTKTVREALDRSRAARKNAAPAAAL